MNVKPLCDCSIYYQFVHANNERS